MRLEHVRERERERERETPSYSEVIFEKLVRLCRITAKSPAYLIVSGPELLSPTAILNVYSVTLPQAGPLSANPPSPYILNPKPLNPKPLETPKY